MEESMQRRERLKAMRVEADESVGTSHNLSNTSTTPPVHLSSPLLDPIAAVEERSPVAQRFDFYTDPMAAFSGNKRRNVQSPPNYFSRPGSSPVIPPPSSLPGPRNLEMPPTPSPQFQSSYSPVLGVYETTPPFHSSSYSRSPNPVGFATRFPGHHATPHRVWSRPGAAGRYGFPPNSPNVGPFHSPDFGEGDNRPYLGRGGVQQFHNYPSSNGPRSDLGRGVGRQFHNFPNPNWERGSPRTHLGRGSGQWLNYSPRSACGRGSPRTDFGRGNDQRFNRNPSPGSARGRGRGRGSHTYVSARESPNSFYNKSMVEDPWRSLKPSVRIIDSANHGF